jgi:hypothetical protein
MELMKSVVFLRIFFLKPPRWDNGWPPRIPFQGDDVRGSRRPWQSKSE